MNAALLVGAAATAITWAQVGRQVYDVRQADDPAAVSLVTWLLALTQSLGLLVLAAAHAYLPALLANGLVALGCWIVLVQLGIKRSFSRLRFAAAILVAPVIIGACWEIRGAQLAGTAGAVAAAVVWLPQAFRSSHVRTRAGLSLTFLVGGLISSSLWILYALLVDEWRLLVPPISATVALLVTLFFYDMRNSSETATP